MINYTFRNNIELKVVFLQTIDYFSTLSSIYLIDNKKPRNFGRRRGFAKLRDKYETKHYP